MKVPFLNAVKGQEVVIHQRNYRCTWQDWRNNIRHYWYAEWKSRTEAELFYGSTLLFSSDAFYIIAQLPQRNLHSAAIYHVGKLRRH